MSVQQIENNGSSTAAPVLGDLDYSTVPAGLSRQERHAYAVGFDRGARAYERKNGGPGIVHDGDAPAAGTAARQMLANTLRENGRAYRIARHPGAHKAGMAAVRRYVKVTLGDPARVIVDPMADGKPARRTPAPRKTSTVKPVELASVPDPAPVTVDPVDMWTPRVVEPVTPRWLEPGEHGPITLAEHESYGYDSACMTPPVPVAPVVAPTVATPAPAPTVAPVERVAPTMSRAQRKEWNRALAATMRAEGLIPSGDIWEARKAAALAGVTA